MAEKGAYLSATFVKKPSIFELIAQDGLSNTFYPAFRHVINYLINRNPLKYTFLQEWFEELYMCFSLVIQYYYLKNYDATFSERFYSLKRIPIDNYIKNSAVRISGKQKFLSLVFSVFFPYVRNKIRVIVESLENEEYKLQIQIPEEYHKFLIWFYKTFHVVFESLCMIYYLQYMIGHRETHSLFLQLAGITLVYFHEQSQSNIYWKSVLRDIISGNWRSSIQLLKLLKGFCGRSLELMAFFIQFLNWWHSEKLHTKFFAYPVPPAPHIKLLSKTVKFQNFCPICKNNFRIPTALPVSGYVFCYSCIRKCIANTGRCPVTNLPVEENDLIRIYAESSHV